MASDLYTNVFLFVFFDATPGLTAFRFPGMARHGSVGSKWAISQEDKWKILLPRYVADKMVSGNVSPFHSIFRKKSRQSRKGSQEGDGPPTARTQETESALPHQSRRHIDSPHKGQWRGVLMLSLICASTNSRANNGDAGDLRRHRANYEVTFMFQC